MPIRYCLVDNIITADPDDYYAQVQITNSVGLPEITDRMVSLGSTVVKADILATIELLHQAVLELILEGNRVNLAGIVDVYPRMQGVFTGITDVYDSSRHQVGVTASAGASLREQVRLQAVVQKDETIKPRPNPLQYADLASDSTDSILTPGTIGTVSGSRLKYNSTNPDEGIYLVPTGAGSAVKVSAVQKNKPTQLVFLVPAGLAAGSYWLEVRARVRGVESLTLGRLDSVLTVS